MARGSDIKAAAVAVMDDVAAIEVTELGGGSSAFVAKLLLTSAGGAVRTVLEMAGIKNVVAKSIGSANAINVARATINGLLQLKEFEVEQ